ncbi:serine/threonine protein kinase [Haliangium ochraceum]|uniref:Serine/threonine protein kinase n=1 Tax=Haliangium ochraceum (strain DSM 14365 / JCM 11303 / SMP-2) TaxID=502025 RepID=D0LX84_HALO1|nr:serine/threonine-protein kinase [Haliangium ochraceum]ACY16126.1 serine/threonine protein kinase [Haliangium ochraceum DSM 14365]
MAQGQQFQDPFIGRVLDGRYEILERIGEGGMGVVYKVRQVPIGRIIALKMLSQEMAQDPNWVKRFEREAKASSQLQHPNTIRMFDFGQTQEGRLFMTMEFLDGRALREVIAHDAPLEPLRVLKILIQACASLAEAHGAGIIHRDIKPDNVFLLNMAGTPDFVKLLDFSVAKLLQENDGMRTQAGIVFGTPQYMSPEQGRGLPLDARSDLYGLGILGFEMLTGYVPFHHDHNPMAVLQMHVQKAVPPLPGNIPQPIQQIIYKSLEKDPAKRHQSAGDMMQDCRQVLAQLEDGGRGPSMSMQQQQPPPHGHGMPPQQQPPHGHGMPPQQQPPHGHGMPPQMHSPQAGGGNAFGPEQKTIVSGGAPAALRQPQPQFPPQGNNQAASAQTVIAQRPPGLPSPQQQMGARPGQPSEAQTIIAQPRPGAGPVVPDYPRAPGAPGGPGGAPSGGYPGPPLPGMPPHGHADDGGPPQTILLPDSEGLVSIQEQLRQINSGAMPHQPGPEGGPPPSQSMTPLPGALAAGEQEGPSTVFWIICIAGGAVIGILAYLLVLLVV